MCTSSEPVGKPICHFIYSMQIVGKYRYAHLFHHISRFRFYDSRLCVLRAEEIKIHRFIASLPDDRCDMCAMMDKTSHLQTKIATEKECIVLLRIICRMFTFCTSPPATRHLILKFISVVGNSSPKQNEKKRFIFVHECLYALF